MDIAGNLKDVRLRIERAARKAGRSMEDIDIIAVTKTVGIKEIEAAVGAGIRHFGESRVQEAEGKISQIDDREKQLTWHMIGHLQRNKVGTALDIFDIIHSIDSLRLAYAVSSQAKRNVPVLVEVNVTGEETKGGFAVEQLQSAIAEISLLPNLSIEGLMTVAPFVSDTEEVRPVFSKLRSLRDSLGLKHLSMGMSDDFEVAVEEGATMLRLGRIIFGERY